MKKFLFKFAVYVARRVVQADLLVLSVVMAVEAGVRWADTLGAAATVRTSPELFGIWCAFSCLLVSGIMVPAAMLSFVADIDRIVEGVACKIRSVLFGRKCRACRSTERFDPSEYAATLEGWQSI